MQYTLDIEERNEYLQFSARGKRSLESILSITKDVLAACERHKLKNALIDVRKMEGELTTMESYKLSAQHLPAMRNLSVLTHVAVIDCEENRERYTFLETVAVNRGLNIRYFTDPHDGVEWFKPSGMSNKAL